MIARALRKELMKPQNRWDTDFHLSPRKVGGQMARITVMTTSFSRDLEVAANYYVSLSICAPDDMFNRKEGRNLALRRLAVAVQKEDVISHADVERVLTYLVRLVHDQEINSSTDIHLLPSLMHTRPVLLCVLAAIWLSNHPLPRWLDFADAELLTWLRMLYLDNPRIGQAILGAKVERTPRSKRTPKYTVRSYNQSLSEALSRGGPGQDGVSGYKVFSVLIKEGGTEVTYERIDEPVKPWNSGKCSGCY